MDSKIIEFIKKKDYVMVNDNLGNGAFGRTVLLKDSSIDELFVCKKYEPIAGADKSKFYDMFKKEIKIMYKLNHPNIVRIYNYYLYDEMNTGYILMEYIDGTTIDKFLSDPLFFLEDDINDLFLQLIKAFASLEQNNIVHRDIRSSNIMVDKNGIVKLIDFGLGKDFSIKGFSKDSLNDVINRLGMEKIPNEMKEGKYDTKTDMFCIAELFDRLLRQNKIEGFKYQSVLNKMLNLDSSKRFKSFDEILLQLNNKQFAMLEVSDEDKKTYQNFTNALISSVSCYTEDPKIEEKVENILNGLREALNENIFEDYIINNTKVIRAFVKCGYKFYSNITIPTDLVKEFFKWLELKEESYQNIIISNLRAKLLSIKTEKADDLPF